MIPTWDKAWNMVYYWLMNHREKISSAIVLQNQPFGYKVCTIPLKKYNMTLVLWMCRIKNTQEKPAMVFSSTFKTNKQYGRQIGHWFCTPPHIELASGEFQYLHKATTMFHSITIPVNLEEQYTFFRTCQKHTRGMQADYILLNKPNLLCTVRFSAHASEHCSTIPIECCCYWVSSRILSPCFTTPSKALTTAFVSLPHALHMLTSFSEGLLLPTPCFQNTKGNRRNLSNIYILCTY